MSALGERRIGPGHGPFARAGGGIRKTGPLNTQLKGEHKLGFLGGGKLEWDASYGLAKRDEPDTRQIWSPRPAARRKGRGLAEVP